MKKRELPRFFFLPLFHAIAFHKVCSRGKKDKGKSGENVARRLKEEMKQWEKKSFFINPSQILESNIFHFHPQGTKETRRDMKRRENKDGNIIHLMMMMKVAVAAVAVTRKINSKKEEKLWQTKVFHQRISLSLNFFPYRSRLLLAVWQFSESNLYLLASGIIMFGVCRFKWSGAKDETGSVLL